MARSPKNGNGTHPTNGNPAPRLALGAGDSPNGGGGAALAQLDGDTGPDVENLLGELGESAAAVQLWRADDRGGKPAYVERIGAEGFSLDYVREVHGAGTYTARVVGQGNKIVKQATFRVAGPVARVETAAAPNDARMDRIERTLELLAQTVAHSAARPAADAGEPLNLALRIVEAMKPAMQPAAPAAGNAADMFDLVTKVLDLRERIADSAEPHRGPDLGAVVEKGVSPLLALFDRQLALEEKKLSRIKAPNGGASTGPAAAAHAMRREPSDTPAPAAVEGGPAELAERVPLAARIYLRGCAAADKDPALYAEVALDALPDDVRAQLPAMLATPGFAAGLVEAVPQWKAYPGWFAQLVEEMRALLDADGDDGDAPNAEDPAE